MELSTVAVGKLSMLSSFYSQHKSLRDPGHTTALRGLSEQTRPN